MFIYNRKYRNMSVRRSQPVTAERVNWRTHGPPLPNLSTTTSVGVHVSHSVFTTLSPRQGCSYRGCAASIPLVPCQGAELRSRCEDHPPPPPPLSESHPKPKVLVSQSQMLMCLFLAAPPPAAGKGLHEINFRTHCEPGQPSNGKWLARRNRVKI